MNEKCIFCNYRNFENRTIFETKFFIFVLDQHQVTDFHFLLVSKKHVTSIGYLSNEEILEAKTIIENLQSNYVFSDKYVTVFERGNKSENKSHHLSIDHAHLHIFILDQSLTEKFLLGQNIINAGLSDLPLQIQSYSYFLLWDVKNSFWKTGNSKDLPSQYIRKFISEETIKKQNWDWKLNPEICINMDIRTKMVEILREDLNFHRYRFSPI